MKLKLFTLSSPNLISLLNQASKRFTLKRLKRLKINKLLVFVRIIFSITILTLQYIKEHYRRKTLDHRTKTAYLVMSPDSNRIKPPNG